MYIVHVTTEMTPIAKVGGLGDVIQGLGKALAQKGEKVEVILPFYDIIDKKLLKNLKVEIKKLFSYEKGKEHQNTIWSAQSDGLHLILIEPHHEKEYFKRGSIYGESDDLLRFIYFCRAALEYLLKQGKTLDILHLHDWLTALCATLYREIYQSLGLKIKKIMTTLHNMQHQGLCRKEHLDGIGLNGTFLIRKDQLQDHTKSNRANLLKGALLHSDFLTTVSPSYLEEIKGKVGFGLGPLVSKNSSKLKGILNGIDTDYWNPETDPLLKKRYQSDPASIEEIMHAKQINRKHLSKQVGIKESQAPLFAVISRLVKQKGPKLILHGLTHILKKGGQSLLIGAPSESETKKAFDTFQKKHRDSLNIHCHFAFNEPLAHLAFASADFILIPSLFEPCGLTQMIALRYGTIPIVHRVGGLKDTIFDIEQSDIPIEKRNGYTFDSPSALHLKRLIDRVLSDFQYSQSKRMKLLSNGLTYHHSWKCSAATYLKLYQSLIANETPELKLEI